MARISTPGIWLPGYINTCNSPSPTGAGTDAAGNPYFQGLNPGKMIVLGTDEAQNAAYPGSDIYDGSYQWVHLDSGATANLATQGYAAYLKLDSGATQGALPETDYDGFTVTTADQATAVGLFCGVFINPATVGGVANGPTPGNWTMIFVGGGRAQVNFNGTVTGGIGAAVIPIITTGLFENVAAVASVAKQGVAVTVPVANEPGLAYYSDIIFHFPS
jgi:hypothetical protein